MYDFYISYAIIWSRILFVGYSMTKKKANIILVSPKEEIAEETIIEEQDGIYYFSLKDNSRHRFSIKDKNLIRETSEMMLELDFKNEKNSKIYLKKEHLEYSLDLKTKKWEITPKAIKIEYELNEEEYLFKIV